MCAEDRSTRSDRRLTDQREVAAEDEAEDASGEVEEEELERAHLTLDDRAAEHLSEDVKQEMDDSGVKEDRQDEAEALVGLLRCGETAEATNLAHGASAVLDVEAGLVRVLEADPRDVGNVGDKLLASSKACASVDQDRAGGPCGFESVSAKLGSNESSAQTSHAPIMTLKEGLV